MGEDSNKKIRNIIYLIVGIIFAVGLSQLELFHLFLGEVKKITFLDIFIGGALYSFTFTFAIGGLILVSAEQASNPFLISFIGAFGALMSDLLIFRFIRDSIGKKAQFICDGPSKSYLGRLICHDYFRWMLPVVGAIIIASPIPDELGVSLIGISSMKTRNFIFLSYVVNFLGILVLVSALKVVS